MEVFVKAFEVGVKEALKFFKSDGGRKSFVKAAEKVMKTMAK